MTDATFHLVCHDCTFEHVLEDRERARVGQVNHARRTGHDVEYDAIEGAVDCEQCGDETPIGELEHLVNVLTNDRAYICEPCHTAGAIW